MSWRSQDPDGLRTAGIATADAVICADDDDALNLEIALLARQANPTVRVVARLANTVLREAMAASNGPGAILDVADLAAPSVVEACLERTTHTISVAGIDFVVSGATRPRRARCGRCTATSRRSRSSAVTDSPNPGRGDRLPRPRRPRARGRLDGDDRHRRRTGRAGHQDRQADSRRTTGTPAAPPPRRHGARVPRRHQPDVLPGARRVDRRCWSVRRCCCASPTTIPA